MIRKIYQPRGISLEQESIILEGALFESMYELLEQIGVFWRNTPDVNDLRTELYTFMINRISIDRNYLKEYFNASMVLEYFKQQYPTKEEAYAAFFTDEKGLQNPPSSYLAYARQKVSNEFISFQLSVGGFKSFGAENYPGYIHGGYIQGKPAPYRTI